MEASNSPQADSEAGRRPGASLGLDQSGRVSYSAGRNNSIISSLPDGLVETQVRGPRAEA
eukprot:3909665-Rhodomonas_salina.1